MKKFPYNGGKYYYYELLNIKYGPNPAIKEISWHLLWNDVDSKF